ncbi:phosphatidate cytidylyltransferase [Ornithinimicrobium avium]|uniref:phosphatidate cytidylyltransferase n=1 Tax=Ornithinimicrobium avium TaxID=2283195 RepID=UPI001E33E49A|nr:phosphatidate cytidylyltransferase [Ornithinimicrobium avium]
MWLCWSLAHLVALWEAAFVVVFAAAAADVAAYVGGRSLRRFGWARRAISPLSPSKTLGGLVGAVLGAVLMLLVLGELRPGMVVAVAVGGVLGDLLESMVKRRAGVKDAGTWLPGFGGLLDRVDSLLVVLPLAAVLGGAA